MYLIFAIVAGLHRRAVLGHDARRAAGSPGIQYLFGNADGTPDGQLLERDDHAPTA